MSIFSRPDLYSMLCKLYSEERFTKTMETLKRLESPRGYSAFKSSTAWCEEKLREAGFSDVRRIAHKADGETAAFDLIMP